MKLTKAESESSLWKKLREHYEVRLTSLRKQNDGNLNTEDTAKLRGRISEVKLSINFEKKEIDIITNEFPGA